MPLDLTCFSDAHRIALLVPDELPGPALIRRWYAEPVQFLVLGPQTFLTNKSGMPRLSSDHQSMVLKFMGLKTPPWILLSDVGTDASFVTETKQQHISNAEPPKLDGDDFPTLQQAHKATTSKDEKTGKQYISQLRALESQQPPYRAIDEQMWYYLDRLQSPLQPLSDNLESVTYEVFEGDPVKYIQYESAITEALLDWKAKQTPTSSASGAVVLAVAGSGRGPLVTRALNAGETAGVPIEVWAIEKNPNAYVYLLRQNEMVWNKKVTVVKTDMRSWNGPLISGTAEHNPVYGKVDILISELLGSFGDNELSPECLDGIQHVLARPHGISIPQSYSAHLSPISTPHIHGELIGSLPNDPRAFDTPWVVNLQQVEHIARDGPDHDRYQKAWEFLHPIPDKTLETIGLRRSGGVVGGGGGSMSGAAGVNDHNSRYCQLTFSCPSAGVVHGLAGYFESTLFESHKRDVKVELSILPDQIDIKSKNMTSWFPIFFPLKVSYG